MIYQIDNYGTYRPKLSQAFFSMLSPSLVGAYGMCVAIGGSLCKEWMDKKKVTDIGAGLTCCSTSWAVKSEWLRIGGYSTAGIFNHIIY